MSRTAIGWLALSLAALVALASLGGSSGAHPASAPRKLTHEEGRWVVAGLAFTRDIEERVTLASAGGSNIASAQRALHDTSRLYAMLVAYTYFGSCSTILRNLGLPSPHLRVISFALVGACRSFERASSLFERAVRGDDASALVAASQASLGAFVPVAAVRTALERLEQ
jgi:hypothetical protein